MIRFSVCLETIFNDLPLGDGIAKAAACGASAVEFWSWRDKDLDGITRAKEVEGVDIAAFAAVNGTSPDIRTATPTVNQFGSAIEAARQIGARGLIVFAGLEREGIPRQEQLDRLAATMADAAPEAAKSHITLLLEPLNARTDHPGTLLSATADAAGVIEKAGQPNVKMLFDIYEQYVTEGSVLHSIESHIGRIGHFHLADVPGRGEPGTGALDFTEMLKLIESLDYDGYVGLEFRPSGDHASAVKSVMELV